MALPGSNLDREFRKFFEHGSDLTGVYTTEASSLAMPANADTITAEYPSSSVEVYKYRQGGISGTVVRTVTVTYTDATKELISSVVPS